MTMKQDTIRSIFFLQNSIILGIFQEKSTRLKLFSYVAFFLKLEFDDGNLIKYNAWNSSLVIWSGVI